MFKTTLSTITTIAITLSTLGADASLSYDGTQANSTTKDMEVVGKPNNNSYIENTQQYTNETYSTEVTYGPVIIDEPREEYRRPAPYAPSEVVKPTPSYKDTIIYAKASKKMFNVGEAIKIKLKLTNKSSLYVWTVGRDGRGYMILPNEFNGYNSFKKNYAYVFPENSLNYEFQSNRAGTEHIYILATSKPISNQKMEEIFNEKTRNYPTANAQATKNFTTKDIHVIAKNENLKYDIAYVAIQVRDGKRARETHRPTQSEKPNRHSNVTVNIIN